MRYGGSEWRAVHMTYPCPQCGARPGYVCRTKSGNPYPTLHTGRIRHALRCPVCAAILDAESEPGDLCPRCLLVRTLELERMYRPPRRD